MAKTEILFEKKQLNRPRCEALRTILKFWGIC